jgi:hypothetical protein
LDDFFFRAFEMTLIQGTAIGFLGPRRLSFRFLSDAIQVADAIVTSVRNDRWAQTYLENATGQREIMLSGIAGHGAYGLLAKAISGHYNTRGYSFNSLQFANSPLSVFRAWETPNESLEGAIEHFRSDLTFQVFTDDTRQMSDWHILPFDKNGISAFFRTPKTAETFCWVAAGCAITDQYDKLCDSLLNGPKFMDMLEKWNRTYHQ